MFTSCFEGRNVLLIYVIEEVNFINAIDECVARGATLARISNEEEFNFTRNFMDDTGFVDVSVWIGMHYSWEFMSLESCARSS